MRGDELDEDGLPGSRGADLSQFYNSVVRTVKTELRVAVPAEVVSYVAPVPGKSPALVRVLLHFQHCRVIDNPAELRAGETLVTQVDRLLARKERLEVPNRPVAYPGHAGMRSSGPLEPGEVGWCIVTDRALDDWINTGGPLDPSMQHLHDYTDCIFTPGLRSGNVAQDIPDDVDRVGREDGSAGMSINRATDDLTLDTTGSTMTLDAATSILLGAAATLGVARLTDTTTADASMQAFLTQLVISMGQIATILNTPGPVIGAPGSVTPLVPATDFGVITSASTKVSSE